MGYGGGLARWDRQFDTLVGWVLQFSGGHVLFRANSNNAIKLAVNVPYATYLRWEQIKGKLLSYSSQQGMSRAIIVVQRYDTA